MMQMQTLLLGPQIDILMKMLPIPLVILPQVTLFYLPYAKVYTRKNRRAEADTGKACGQEGMGVNCN